MYYKNMIKNIIMYCFIIVIFSNCTTWETYNFRFNNPNETIFNRTIPDPFISLIKSGDNDYFISITHNKDTLSQIEKFEFIEGSIKIGDYEIKLNKEETDIFIDVNRMFNRVYYVISGVEYISKLSDSIEMENNSQYINYTFGFTKRNITQEEINIIISEYKRGNKKTTLYLRYSININNELNINEVINEYNIKVEITKWNNVTASILRFLHP